MCKYVIKKENDIKYFQNGQWVFKENAEIFDWETAENTVRELKCNGIKTVIESR